MRRFFLKLIDRWQKQVKKNYLDRNLDNLKAGNFTVVSSNCWGGILYQDLGLNYQTPFVNQYMHAPCFLKLVKQFPDYMKMDLIVSTHSKYFSSATSYPVGHLGDIEIHFIHYSLNDNVIGKWNERKARINSDALLFVLCERDQCTAADLEEFDQLPVNKLIFTAKKYNLKNSHKVFSLGGQVLSADLMMGFSYKKADIIGYLNQTFTK
ncbi:MAG TPA: DUF1919 domain-containing protein [Cyclobacteriaceae bacterium]|nr:DUF1919 domain-containing protein [Cyclobacteriaceae bacterium]